MSKLKDKIQADLPKKASTEVIQTKDVQPLNKPNKPDQENIQINKGTPGTTPKKGTPNMTR